MAGQACACDRIRRAVRRCIAAPTRSAREPAGGIAPTCRATSALSNRMTQAAQPAVAVLVQVEAGELDPPFVGANPGGSMRPVNVPVPRQRNVRLGPSGARNGPSRISNSRSGIGRPRVLEELAHVGVRAHRPRPRGVVVDDVGRHEVQQLLWPVGVPRRAVARQESSSHPGRAVRSRVAVSVMLPSCSVSGRRYARGAAPARPRLGGWRRRAAARPRRPPRPDAPHEGLVQPARRRASSGWKATT